MRTILKKQRVISRLALTIGLAASNCNNTALYDEAINQYPRIVRSGLNEWYPLNGNLTSRVGSVAMTATNTFSAGANRAGEAGKSACLTASPIVEFDSSASTFGSEPFSIGMWVRIDTVPGLTQSLFERGTQNTSYQGFRIEVTSTSAVNVRYSNNVALDTTIAQSTTATGAWYYYGFSYGNGVGTFYAGKYGGNLVKIGNATSAYVKDGTPFQIFSGNVDGCVDDLVHYSRVLTAEEFSQNFLSLE
jgi:hypothetical protein